MGGSVCCAGMRPFIFTSSCGNGSPGALWLCRLQWLPLHRGLVPPAFRQAFRGSGFASASFPSLSFPLLSLPPSDGKHGLCSCQPREARLPPTGIVMEGNLGAAPLRRLHGMPPPPPDGWKHAAVDRSGVVVFTVGGWDFLPPLLWGRVRFPVCLLVFLACRRGVGVGDAPTTLAPQPGCRGVAKRLPNAHPSPGSRLCSGTGEHAWAPPSSPRPCALRLRPPCSSGTGPVATGSRRRRLVLRLSQKDALQALFQQNPYPGIATRERLARELGIAESRVQVGPRLCPRSPFQALHADPSRLKATGGLSPQKAFSVCP